MDTEPLRVADPYEPDSDYLRERLEWLVGLRWTAITGVVLATLVAGRVAIVPDARPLLAVAGAMAAYNAGCWVRSRRGTRLARGALEMWVFLQILLDVAALALLVHWSGGLENPFAMFFVFHMALGAMLLPYGRALALGALASAFYTALGLAELSSRSASFVVGHVVAFGLVQFGTLYFVHSVVERHRKAEALQREHDRIAQSRERLARVGEIAAGVAHAVRNPLHGLLASVDILAARTNGDGTGQEMLDLMREALRRIEGITQRLLLLTREAPLHRVPRDLDSLVVDALRLVSPSSRGSAARVEVEVRGAGIVEVDSDRFTEMLTHVVDNALDACRGGGSVAVRTSFSPCWIDEVEVEVEDDGPGIPREHLPRIFDPFFSTKAIGEGSGLGLALTRRGVEEHGGQLIVESEPGKGTKVRIRLPRRMCLPGRNGGGR